MNYTANEKKVYNQIAAISFGGSVADIDDIVGVNGLDAKQARGVISSLVKKDLITIDEFQNGFDPVEIHYWPTLRFDTEVMEAGDSGFFWCDELSKDEYEAQLIEDDKDEDEGSDEEVAEEAASPEWAEGAFNWDGMYLMYHGDAGKWNTYYEQPCHPTREGMRRELFIARFKYGSKPWKTFRNFIMKNFTVEEWFELTTDENRGGKGMTPVGAAETKGYVMPHIKKQLKAKGYPQTPEGFKQMIADEIAEREAAEKAAKLPKVILKHAFNGDEIVVENTAEAINSGMTRGYIVHGVAQ